jgi:uncharacterized protein YacL
MLKVVHGFLVMAGTMLGVLAAYSLDDELLSWIHESTGYPAKMLLGILLGGVGYLTGATISSEFSRWLQRRLPQISSSDVLWGSAGLGLGLAVANLFCVPILLFLNTEPVRTLLRTNPLLSVLTLLVPLFFNILLGSLGIYLFTARQRDLAGLLFRGSRRMGVRAKVLDTSAIIDGRVMEILRTGMLEGPVEVPQFVLHELQCVADSRDPVRRERGRRGFEHLERLKSTPGLEISFPVVELDRYVEVDAKLVAFCQESGAVLLTVDYNLNKLAGLQEVRSININEVANALRPSVLSGDQLRLEVIKRGKDTGQGVGYLPDGTMVIVEGGAELVGSVAIVNVNKILQTSAGRMVFTTVAPAVEASGTATDGAAPNAAPRAS